MQRKSGGERDGLAQKLSTASWVCRLQDMAPAMLASTSLPEAFPAPAPGPASATTVEEIFSQAISYLLDQG